MHKLKSLAYGPDLNEALLTLLILSFPFGSSFLSFSLGFMTIYPYLVILVVLTWMALFRKTMPETKMERYYLYFLIFFLVYGLAFLPFVESTTHALVDIRSSALMLMTGYVLLAQHRFLGTERWTKSLTFSLRVVFVAISAFGVFEFVSGIHFYGQSTEHIIDRGVVDMAAYSPMFLWDNPNNFFVYHALIGALVILLEKDAKKRNYTAIAVFSLSFVFSILVLSRIGQFVSLICLLVSITVYFAEIRKADQFFFRKTIWYLAFTIGALTISIISKEKFYGIPNERKMRLTELVPIFPDLYNNYLVSKHQVDSINPPQPNPAIPDSMKGVERTSEDERSALLKNGFDFVVESKGLGVGPGQYRYLHESGKIRHYAFGNNGAHFWLIELISQFGVFVFLAYCVLFIGLLVALVRFYRRDKNFGIYFLLANFCFAAASALPSAFLILDIHWIFMAVLVVIAAPVLSKPKSNLHA